MTYINKITISGKEVFPIIEGGKGIGVSNGSTAGAFAACDAVGTISAVFTPDYDPNGTALPFHVKSRKRKDRSREIIMQSIEGCCQEIEKAHEISKGKGRIHINIMWGIAGAEEITTTVLKRMKGKVHGITCGAGMPYRLAEIAKGFGVYYYPIISSARAFASLWKRAYAAAPELLGGVVYEDPWLAGGHNGFTNKENPEIPENAFDRIALLRKEMTSFGLAHIPIIIAGGVWDLKDFKSWMNNPLIGPLAFQLGTRPMLTKESPISDEWKKKLTNIEKGDVTINKFSATGFYSSAVKNNFMKELFERSKKQIPFRTDMEGEFESILIINNGNKNVFVKKDDLIKAHEWLRKGFSKILRTPDETLLFVTPEKGKQIQKDQNDCKGCLVACKFSGWSSNKETNYSTGQIADPRSFCILQTLQNIICDGDVENELMFSGHNAYRFKEDPMYRNGHIPTTEELITSLLEID